MIMNSSLTREPPIYMTTVLSSLPPLISSTLSDLSLSSEDVSKHLVKIKENERQSPVLAKGEVEMSENWPVLFLSRTCHILVS